MLELVTEITLLLGLFTCAWIDWKKQLVYSAIPAFLGIVGICFHIVSQSITIWNVLAGMSLGGVFLVISWLTKEEVGMGDGIIFMLTGIYLGFWNNLELIVLTLLLAGVIACVLMISKKKGRKDRMPMIPIVFVAYVILLL